MGSFQEFHDVFYGFQKLVCYDSYCQHLKPHVDRFTSLQLKDWTLEHFNSAVSCLAQFILAPECVDSILECFSHLAPTVVATALEKEVDHQSLYVCLGKLFANQNGVIQSFLRYFDEGKPPWVPHEAVNPSKNPKRRKMSVRQVTDLEIVECCWNLLRADFRTFSTKWCWSSFLSRFATSKDAQVVWVACQCLAKVLNMDENTKQQFMSKLLTPSKIVDCQLQYEKTPGFQTWLKHPTFKTLDSSAVNRECRSGPSLSTKMYADVGGILLPVFHKDQVEAGNLVLVKSTESNLRRIAIGVSSNRAVGLMGPVGCGKSALIEHLANYTGRRTDVELLKVQLGEETDSKLLLGTYKCTDVPGEFIWEPGVLTKAVMGGHWLLIEDIESAASDVAAVLANLLEYKTINVPGYRDNVPAAPGFHLFMTHRLLPGGHGHHRKQTTATELLEKHWLQVNVEPLTTDELIQIIQVKFPLLKTIASRMVAVYMLFTAGEHEGGPNPVPRQAGQRLISTRDLLKWCTRAECGFEVTSPESALKVLQDAIDIFCCSYSDLAFRSKIAGDMAACLGIIKTKAEYFCNIYKPSVTLDSRSCTAGRANLLRMESGKPVTLDQFSDNLRFALTRESSCLLERLAVCLSLNEPVLIVGETGTGKTSTIQLLAKHTSHKLVVINMNQQSDSSDLLGGYKPVDLKQTVVPIREEFEHLFRSLFSVQANQKFLENISVCVSKRMWTTLLKMMAQSQAAALKRLSGSGSPSLKETMRWRDLGDKINRLQAQLRVNRSAMAFSFIEGSLVRALKEGHWVLLDEINLACAETLQCLSGLLEETTGSVSLLERGDTVKIPRHPNFRLLAAMNPATDFGKKDLPPGVRNRFTELFVSEHSDKNDLSLVVKCYLPDLPPSKVEAVVKFYLLVKKKAADALVDSTGHRPLYSLRTLCRGLVVAAENKCGNTSRSLYEALCLSFLTQLNSTSHVLVKDMIAAYVLDTDTRKSVLSQPIPEPSKGKHICFEGYWVEKGHTASVIDEKYLLTPSVRKNLCDIARCVSMSNHPILIQGETSVGKTSLITYLARAAGHKCYRINNHQHTDLQEYVGTYCADPATGSLVFREGVLVDAMRNGHWIILDELNLAPSEVLEALNRVLDDNRELFITETQVTVKAHPSFRLFATQNPPGLYGGRKMLSRAFRNRFVELHFDEIPPPELENILQHRCNMPLSYCKKLVAVMMDLQVRRRGSATFAGKLGFITLRDLFRWGERYRLAQSSDPGKYYDWDQHIADEGYLVLAGRVRKNEECEIIRSVLEKKIKRTVNIENLFSLGSETSVVTKHILEKIVGPTLPNEFRHIVWTYNLRKTAVLVGKAIEFCEPLLLVGETGCGKTTICQLIAAIQRQVLYSVNCHQHSESSDFLGGLRPVRDKTDEKGKLFEWIDGPLIIAVKDGMMFLADEISLADDSVLERLNSLLEPERRLMVSEKGSDEDVDITAAPNFRFVGTMNPGGDYGKKELSPALRNRLTEVWCEGPTTDEDMFAIVEHNVRFGLSLGNQQDGSSGIGTAMIQFLNWFKLTETGKRIQVSVRDVLTWVRFINLVASNNEDNGTIDVASAYVHGACLTLLDGIGTATTASDNVDALKVFRSSCIEFLLKQVDAALGCDHSPALEVLMKPESLNLEVVSTPEKFGLHPFYIDKGVEVGKIDFTFEAPTTCLNTLRLIRSLQIPSRAILLEGSPGVGKTSIVTALAKASGHQVTRINLSEQTDISDLFGADLPVEGAKGGTFAWRDGPFLKALKQGHWILLDELNLASQSVVEGLNSVLDHRGEIYVPELGRSFHIKADSTRLFACQNPQRQGGARKGLPLSFLNRFTQVFMEPLSKDDLLVIVRGSHPEVDPDLVQKMVELTVQLNEKAKTSSWGSSGGPYEWNLRDLNFWIQSFSALGGHQNPGAFVKTIYADRLRKPSERQDVLDLYQSIFGHKYPLVGDIPPVMLNSQNLLIGEVCLPRTSPEGNRDCTVDSNNSLLVLRHQISTLRSLALCVRMGWLSILVGDSYSGKTSVLNTLAHLAGKNMFTIPVSSAMDTTELLGGFEQTDYGRHLDSLYQKVRRIVNRVARFHTIRGNFDEAHRLLQIWRESNVTNNQSYEEIFTLDKALHIMKKRIESLQRVLSVLGQAEHQCSVHSLSRIVKTLDALNENVEKQSSLTAGNFEWVDSILVKCLEEGHWLVVDNVNLCSGAVLDRLNGLLEPEGVLVLGERGVGPDGGEVVIRPHQDFRIFFTFDPAHGNISRAMRNRGVEIYVERLPLFIDPLSPQDDYSKFLSKLDSLSLLRHMGFTSCAHAQSLLHIHDKLAQLCAGYESPHLGHLMDVAFLALHNWKRGQNLVSVTERAFTDVYIKSRVMSVEQKLKLTSALSDAITCVTSDMVSESLNFMDCFGDSVMLQTLQLDENSVFECIKHQGGVILAVMNLFKMVTLSDSLSKNLSSYSLSDFEALGDTVNGTDYKILDTLPFVVIAFYTFASSNDVDLRHAWLQSLADSSPKTTITQLIYDKILLISDVVRNVLKLGLPPSNSPWDLRHVSPLPVGDCSLQNRLHALICYKVVQACDTDESSLSDKKINWKSLTIIQYSNAIKQGLISDLPTNLVIICEISRLFELLENVIVHVFNSPKTHFTLDRCWEWLHKVAWKFRLLNMTRRRLFSTPPSHSSTLPPVNLETLNYLTQHYKWFRKHTLPMLLELSNCVATVENDVSSLMGLIDLIDKSIDLGKIHLIPLCRQVMRLMEQPSPMKTTEQCDLSRKIHRLEDSLKIWRFDLFGQEALSSDCGFVASPKGQECRHKMIACNEQIFGNSDIIQGAATAEELELMFETAKQEPAGDRELGVVRMWPFFELVAIRLNSALRNILSQSGVPSSNESLNLEYATSLKQSLVNWFSATGCISPTSVGVIKAGLDLSNMNSQNWSSVMFHLTSHMHSSFAIHGPLLFLEWDGKATSHYDDLCVSKNNDIYPQDPMLAVFLGCVVNQLKKAKASGSSLALKSHRNTMSMVQNLRTMLWRNMPTIFSNSLNSSLNEEEFLRNSYLKLLQILSSCLKIGDTQECVGAICSSLAALNFDSGKTKGHKCDSFVLPVVDTLQSLEQEMSSLQRLERDSSKWWISIGKCWSLIGYVHLTFFSNLELIDPVHKEAVKRQYRLEELKELKVLLCVQELTRAVVGATGSWPLKDQYKSKIEELEAIKACQEGIAVRPYPSRYNKITTELKSFMESLFAHEKFQDITSRLDAGEHNAEAASRTRTEVESWLMSVRSFHYRLKNQYYASYPDVVTPALLALSQVIWGMETALSNMHKCIVKLQLRGDTPIQQILELLVSVTDIPSSSRLIDLCCSSRMLTLLKKCDDASASLKSRSPDDRVRLSKICMSLVRSLRGTYKKGSLYDYVFRVLEFIVDSWEKLQEENKIKIAQEQSIYINKLTPIQQEEEERKNEVRQLFPTTREQDFGDIEGPDSLEDVGKIYNEQEGKESEKIGLCIEDVEEICDIHRDIVRTSVQTPWFVEVHGTSDSPFQSTLLNDRVELFWKLLSGPGMRACDEGLSCVALPGLLVALSQPFDSVSTDIVRESDPDSADFYHDPNVNEATQCIALLQAILTRVEELLAEWPDHPTLKLIKEIILRISGFSITSPLSRFLTGLELLLTRLHEWEENAHDGVSLSRHAASLTNQIISWRRLELTAWKGALLSRKKKVATGARKWWFHLYSLTISFLRGDTQDSSADDLVKSLENFMETSSLGEYSTRLQLLLTFHCHCLILPQSERQKELTHIFWNIHRFYDQFNHQVASKIIELGAPIEKKLKEYVKIARWNDINYWAVKAAVEKTHNTVHKHIKDYEKILLEPASCAMTKLSSGPPRLKLPLINFVNYLTKFKPLGSYEESSDEDMGNHLLRLESLLRKSRRNCKDIITSCPYPSLLKTLNIHLQEWKDVGDLICQFEIDPSVPQEKKRSAAKVLLQRKRRAVAEMLRSLAQLGLSYRSGLHMYETTNTSFALLSPLDIKVGLQQLSSRPCDQDLITSWNGTDGLFLSSVAQYAQLKRSMQVPHKDLGPITIEKLKGFTAYLTQLAREMKESICQNALDMYSVRCLMYQIGQVPDENFRGVNSTVLHSNQVDVLEEIDNLIFTLKQFTVVLDACPERSQSILLHTVFPTSINHPMVNAYKHDDHWDQAKLKIDSLLRTASKLKSDINKANRHRNLIEKTNPTLLGSVDTILLESQLKTFHLARNMLNSSVTDLQKIVNSFGSDINGSLCLNPLTKCLENLATRLSEVGLKWRSEELTNEGLQQQHISEFSTDVNRLVHKSLILIQNVYKSHVSKSDSNLKPSENANIAEEEETFSLEDGHLNEKIVSCLNADFNNLKMNEFSQDLAAVLLKLNQTTDSATYDQCLRILRNAYPLLDQVVYLFQYFLTQQTSTLKLLSKINGLLLGIFTEFAKNGYNVPEELREDGEEGEGEETKGGMGLGEGEGEKDVSDQIESLDQLEDAKRPEDYKNQKEEHKECKEEEKGIDMEEDMDGELQDLEKNENEDEEDDGEDDKDLDKEMGDTEKGAEALDKEVWGSDSEEEEESNDELPEDEGNRGSEQTEKEMRAKNDDEEDGGDEQGDDKDNKQRDQKKPEINEMEDQEIDDDQIDPYHGNQPPTPEVEPLDIPDNLDMDGDSSGEEENKEDEENPFDIDKMKENAVAEEEPENKEGEEEKDRDVEEEQNKGPEEGEDEGEHKDFSKPELIREEEEQEKEKETDGENKENEAAADEVEAEDNDEVEETVDAVQVEKPSEAKAESSEDKKSSSDQVTNTDEAMEQNERQKNDNQQEDGREEDGSAGAAEKEETDEGGRIGTAGKQQRNTTDKEREDQKRQRPGDSNVERSLGEASEPVKKKLKTIEAGTEKDEDKQDEETMEEGVEEDHEADLYQHIKEAKQNAHDTQVIDAATKEQAAEQKPVINKEDEEAEALKEEEEISQMDEDVEEPSGETPKPKSDSKGEDSKKENQPKGKKEGDVMEDATLEVDIEGEVVSTMSVARGPDSSYHTQMDQLTNDDDRYKLLSEKDVFRLRQELQEQLATWSQPPAEDEATEAWEKLSSVTSGLSRDLSEQLRLVLEPTTASGLKGDFRTGRRINMRKVIPYIASQFRKDKIWLRRSKPSKREYQIVMAIDDSSSMADNQSKELAFESLALVSRALTLLEAGDLAVLSFGESISVLHELGQPFTDSSGARLVQQLTFDQKRTKVGALVDYTTALLRSCAKKTDADVAQLLVILSDGRGVMSEGEASVLSAVRSAKHNRIFMIFVIIESPNSKDSILDIRQPCFKDGKLLGITSYMDNFPFPFYLILRNITNLPSVLSDALRQWFELVTNSQ